MTVRGWLILGGHGHNLPSAAYCGDVIGALPGAESFGVGQWILWRPVAALVAGSPQQMAVVCVEIPL